MADSSCRATMPLRTNSTTACDDWQSQMPAAVSGEPTIPKAHTVASYDDKLVVLGELMLGDVRVCGDYLLLGGKLGRLLELEVANGARQRQISVDTSEVDEASRGRDPCTLRWHMSATP
jgi:hypothetical protein